MVDIIIVQTSFGGNETAKKIVEELELTDRVRVFRNFGFAELNQLIDVNRQQLFVTGTFRGNTDTTIDLVDVLCKKYPKLLCYSYSFDEFPCPPFHGNIIKKEDGPDRKSEGELKSLILGFLENLEKETESV